jgi:hypothetical protein
MSGLYNNAKEQFARGAVNWASDDIRCLLTTSSYTPDIDSHDFVSSVTNELSGGNYVRDRQRGGFDCRRASAAATVVQAGRGAVNA